MYIEIADLVSRISQCILANMTERLDPTLRWMPLIVTRVPPDTGPSEGVAGMESRWGIWKREGEKKINRAKRK